jgi:hypothetical protein
MIAVANLQGGVRIVFMLMQALGRMVNSLTMTGDEINILGINVPFGPSACNISSA